MPPDPSSARTLYFWTCMGRILEQLEPAPSQPREIDVGGEERSVAVDGLGRDERMGSGERDPPPGGEVREVGGEQVVPLRREDDREAVPQTRHQRLVLGPLGDAAQDFLQDDAGEA